MIEDPDRWAPAYAEAGAGSVTFHVEAAAAPVRLARALRAAGARAGMALKPATPVEPYVDLLPELDMLLVMTVEPGFGGQAFLDVVLPKIRRAREADRGRDLDVWLQVDGGVSAETIERCAEAGRRRLRRRLGGLRRRTTRPRRSRRCARRPRPLARRRVTGRILVADDDPDIARFVELNLSLEGFEVRGRRTTARRRWTVRADPPDLLLLDVMMPVARRRRGPTAIRVERGHRRLPVVLLTAKSLSADKVVGLTAGADDYIVKPFDTLELIARVQTTLRRTAEMRSTSPLTGLPGNHRIDLEIAGAGPRRASRTPSATSTSTSSRASTTPTASCAATSCCSCCPRACRRRGWRPASRGRSSGTSAATTSSWSARPEQGEPLCERLVASLVDAGAAALRRRPTSSAAASRSPTAGCELRRHPLVTRQHRRRAAAPAASATTARSSPRPAEMKSCRQEPRRLVVAVDRRRGAIDAAQRDPSTRRRGRLAVTVTRAPGQVQFRTGGDSPRPARSQPAVDPVELRDRR